MRFWQLFIRNLRESRRDPLALCAVLAFPLIFMLVFGVALGSNELPSYNVAVVNNDAHSISTSFISDALSVAPTLKISHAASAEEATNSLKLGDIQAFIVIPPGFGDAVSAVLAGADTDINLDLTYDKGDMAAYGEISNTVNAILCEFAGIKTQVTIHAQPNDFQTKVTEIDFLAPGIIIFGLLIMIPTSARLMTRDRESGVLSRLLTTPTSPWEFVAGYGLCLLAIATAQIIIFLLFGWLFGMDITGNLALAFLIFILTAMASIGLGMITAALSKSSAQAESLTWLLSMPMAALSGVWFSITFMPHYVQIIAKIFPYAHAVEAARAVIVRGADLSVVGGNLLVILCWAIGTVLLGVFMFNRTMRT